MLMARITFYSNRTSAHAAITVAGIFATYSMLSLMGRLPDLVFGLSYVALVVFDFYSFWNFGYYASAADDALHEIQAISPYEFRPKGRLNKWLESFKKHSHIKDFLLYVVWSLGVGIPTIWVVLRLFRIL